MSYIQITSTSIKGNKIDTSYSVSSDLSKYFNNPYTFTITYSCNLDGLPQSIAVIPFVCNILPLIWLTNSELFVDSLDQDFFESIDEFKKGYIQMYPMLKFLGKVCPSIIQKNHHSGDKYAMFFSGGADAFATLFAHISEKPDLMMVHGSDVFLNDIEGWANIKRNGLETAKLFNLQFHSIASNFREILNVPKLEELINLVNDSWWHGFQHGIGLIGLSAPLCFVNGFQKILIASSYTINEKGKITCASDPSIDNFVKFAGTNVFHDQYEFTRQEKINHICQFTKKEKTNIKLHVCWETRTGNNCCNCEKCYRTIMEIAVEGFDPNSFGFNVGPKTYQQIKRDISHQINMAPHIVAFWKDIQNKANKTDFTPKEVSWVKHYNFDKVNETIYKKTRRFIFKIPGTVKFINFIQAKLCKTK